VSCARSLFIEKPKLQAAQKDLSAEAARAKAEVKLSLNLNLNLLGHLDAR
jgi:hypothetical protein